MNSVKWNETRRIGAIFACFYVARVWQRQLGFLVNPGNALVNFLCTRSTRTMSCMLLGDHTTELYSTDGQTYTIKAFTSKSTSLDTKQRNIALARWCAFATICPMCSAGFKFCETITPRSRHDITAGNLLSFICKFSIRKNIHDQCLEHCIFLQIIGCSVAQHCCNDDQQRQWENRDFDPCRSETPENFMTKIGHIDYVAWGGGNTHAKFYGNSA